MKKLIYFMAFFGLICLHVHAKPLKITRSGSANGTTYDFVQQDPGWFQNRLNCRKPGNINCSWVSTSEDNGIAVIVDLLHQEIEAAVLSGSTSGSLSGAGFTGTWTGSVNEHGQADYTAELEVED
jgi:hypothetical protein